LYNTLKLEVKRMGDGLGVELSPTLAEMLHVGEGDNIEATLTERCVELRSEPFKSSGDSFESLQMVGNPVLRFSSQFGEGEEGEDIFMADVDYLCLYDKAGLVALMKYSSARKHWLPHIDAEYVKTQGISVAALNQNKQFLLKWEGGKPVYSADADYAYHAILVLESLLILGETSTIMYPKTPAPLMIVDNDEQWCILIKPRINPELESSGQDSGPQ